MIVIDVENELDLENTLTCGQIFRYQQEIDNSFTVVISDMSEQHAIFGSGAYRI